MTYRLELRMNKAVGRGWITWRTYRTQAEAQAEAERLARAGHEPRIKGPQPKAEPGKP